ncbi:hypothetical protein FPL14_10010 [Cohnella cholangitidis]|uniref:S-layer homology domain-containing protein n=1 Tax=Cohnella cholangitidis TaxID=2598458 RepID=A0A7G5BX07_9BACL|nr:hypothetical protein FPL14_10010 [Cohnella cholangitidis]
MKLIDALGNAQTAGGAMVGITSTLGTVSGVTDNGNGTYTATLTAPTTLGIATISASVDGNPIAPTASVEFLLGDVSAQRSTVTASDLVVRADGAGKASIFVKLKDDYDHPIAGKRVLLQANGGSSVIQAVYDVTDADGLALFTVSNTAAENVTYSAKEATTGLTLIQTVNVAFTYDQPPRIVLQANPIAPTFGNVTVTVTASVYGHFNSLSSIKWAPGSRAVSYFDTQGVAIADRFTVQENGIYSVYAVDTAGNANVSLIEVRNIVPMSNNANLADWQLMGTGGTVNFAFDSGTTDYNIQVTHSVTGLKMLLATSDSYSIVSVNGMRATANSITGEYPLATGNNAFEVNVKAQDGTVKKYTLNVNRSAASTNPGPSSPSNGTSPSSPSNPSPSNTIAIRINDTEVSGVAALRTGADGVKSIDVLLDSEVLKKVLSSSATAKANLSISIEDEAGLIALRLPGDAISLLPEEGATILLKTRQGQYRLPLDEVISRKTDWTTAAEAQVTIAFGEAGGIAGLRDAANKGGFRLVGNPVHFNVHIIDHGEKREIASFGHYVERVIYLPTEADDHTTSTVVVWDEKLGARPVPTEFALVDGRRAAVIRSLTNGVFAVVSKQSLFADVQGHWAANEISEMNSRLIVQGVDGGRFDPDAEVTRAEFAALLARALGLPEGGGQASFLDVGRSNWYSGAPRRLKRTD